MAKYSLSSAEENGHNECMREAHFHAIDESVACSLQDPKVIMIRGVREDSLRPGHVQSRKRVVDVDDGDDGRG